MMDKQLQSLIDEIESAMEVPSRVPTAPGLETTGGVLGAEEVDELMDDETAVSLGELDPSLCLKAEIKEEYQFIPRSDS